jgi:hypothetical protein
MPAVAAKAKLSQACGEKLAWVYLARCKKVVHFLASKKRFCDVWYWEVKNFNF